MSKKLANSVRVVNENGVQQILEAGSEVPSWAEEQITNEDAFMAEGPEGPATVEVASEVEGEAGAPFTEAAVEVGGVDYSAMRVAELRSLAESRNLPADGSKADLVAALEAADRV